MYIFISPFRSLYTRTLSLVLHTGTTLPTGETLSIPFTEETLFILSTGETLSTLFTGETLPIPSTEETLFILSTGETLSILFTGETLSILSTIPTLFTLFTGDVLPTTATLPAGSISTSFNSTDNEHTGNSFSRSARTS
jgi:hypothetical protein